MNILYLGYFNNPFTSETFAANAMEKLGHTVTRIDEATTSSAKLPKQLENQDMLIFSRIHIDGVNNLAKVIKNFDGISSFWIYDIMYNLNRSPKIDNERKYWLDTLGPIVNHAFMVDSTQIPAYEEAGINHHIIRQGVSADHKFIGKINSALKGFDVGFVGSIYSDYRKDLITFLNNKFSISIRGNKDMYELRGQDLADFCVTIPIIIGDNGQNISHVWSNRIYNMIGHGGFYIGPDIAGLEEEFTDGEHFIAYPIGDFEALEETIYTYLRNPAERIKIAKNGFKHVWNNFTYDHRVKKLMQIIQES